jgi:hypothetical protein
VLTDKYTIVFEIMQQDALLQFTVESSAILGIQFHRSERNGSGEYLLTSSIIHLKDAQNVR